MNTYKILKYTGARSRWDLQLRCENLLAEQLLVLLYKNLIIKTYISEWSCLLFAIRNEGDMAIMEEVVVVKWEHILDNLLQDLCGGKLMHSSTLNTLTQKNLEQYLKLCRPHSLGFSFKMKRRHPWESFQTRSSKNLSHIYQKTS